MGNYSSHADVLIAGGGVAGSALAILLGRRGFRVELFEREQFPREKPCGEGLMPAGVAVLERLGLAEAVGGVPFQGIRYHFSGRTAEGRFPCAGRSAVTGRAQRRKHLDQVLFRAAASTPGVTAQAGITVEAPVVEGDRVVGARVEGEARRARLVVAADGVHSRIRQALGLGLATRRRRLGARAHFRLPSDPPMPAWVDVFVGRGYELYVAPLPNREMLVAALANSAALCGPIERAFERWWRAQPALAARLEGAEQVSPILCSAPLAAQARAGVAPGAVLLGDAAGSLDPITGGGMTHALLTAELLAAHVPGMLAGHQQAFGRFERERRALLRDYRMVTRGVLWLTDHPAIARPVLAALCNAPRLLSHFIGVAGGIHPLFGGSHVVAGLLPGDAERSHDQPGLGGVKPPLHPLQLP